MSCLVLVAAVAGAFAVFDGWFAFVSPALPRMLTLARPILSIVFQWDSFTSAATACSAFGLRPGSPQTPTTISRSAFCCAASRSWRVRFSPRLPCVPPAITIAPRRSASTCAPIMYAFVLFVRSRAWPAPSTPSPRAASRHRRFHRPVDRRAYHFCWRVETLPDHWRCGHLPWLRDEVAPAPILAPVMSGDPGDVLLSRRAGRWPQGADPALREARMRKEGRSAVCKSRACQVVRRVRLCRRLLARAGELLALIAPTALAEHLLRHAARPLAPYAGIGARRPQHRRLRPRQSAPGLGRTSRSRRPSPRCRARNVQMALYSTPAACARCSAASARPSSPRPTRSWPRSACSTRASVPAACWPTVT